MTRNAAVSVALVLASPLSAASVRAQTLYLSAEPARPQAGDEVRVTLTSGVPFAGTALAGGDRPAMRLERLWHGGRVILEGDSAGGPATFHPAEAGVQLVAYGPRDGVDEGLASFGKAVLVVGEPERGGRIWRSELGQRLEIVPETDPVALARAGGQLEIQVLFRREPLAGATVVAVAEGATEESYRRRVTDRSGRVHFDLDRPGRWLVHLAHKRLGRGGESGRDLFQSSLLVAAGP
jgi:hypothetical protein